MLIANSDRFFIYMGSMFRGNVQQTVSLPPNSLNCWEVVEVKLSCNINCAIQGSTINGSLPKVA